MPSDPRLVYGWDEQDAHMQSLAADSTITPPVLSVTGLTNSPSAQQGFAVANVATGSNAPEAGLGSSGNPLFGKVKQVEVDGTVTIQDRGYMTLPFVTGGSVPIIGDAVDVDGTGKVLHSSTFRGARCEGFVNDPVTNVLACLVKRF